MLPTIKQLRDAAGGLSNLTDEDIVQAVYPSYQRYYPKLDEFAGQMGYSGSGRGMAGSRISAGVDNYQANMYGLGGAVSRSLGLDSAAQWMDEGRIANESAANYATQRARELGAVDNWRDVNSLGTAANYVGGLAAQSLPYLGEAAAGALTGGVALGGTAARMGLTRGAASMAGAVGASYPSAVGDVLSSQRDETGQENLGSAALGGVPYAALNAMGVEGLMARGLRPIGAGAGGLGSRVARGVATTAVGEGIGETGQEMVNQYFGRMAVNPDQTMFNPEANERYLDSFVGGAALGGVFGGVGGIRRPVQENQPYDLAQERATPQGPIPQLGFSPLAGTPIVFPDGTVTLNGEQELAARYGTPLPQTGIPDMGAEEAAPAAPRASAVFTPEETRLMDLGITAQGNRAKLANEILDAIEQSGLPQEQANVVMELMKGGAIPGAKKAVDLFNEAAAAGVPDAELELVRQAVMSREFAQAKKQLKTAITERNKTNGQAVNAPSVPPAVPTAGAAPAAATVAKNQQIDQAATAATGSAATRVPGPATVASTQQPGVAPAVVEQPVSDTAPTNLAERVVRRKRVVTPAAPSPFFVSPEALGRAPAAQPEAGLALEDQAAIAELTSGPTEAITQLQEDSGQRTDGADPDETLKRLLTERFAGSKNATRDTEIAQAYLTAMRSAPKGSKVKIQKAIGDRYGIGPEAVRKVGDTTKLVEAGRKLGMTEAEVRTLLEVRDNTKAAPGKAVAEGETDNTVLTEGLKAAGVEVSEGDTLGFGDDTARTWQQGVDGMGDMSNATDEVYANQVASILDQKDRLLATLEELEQQGQIEAAAEIQDQVAALDARVGEALARYQQYLSNEKPKTKVKSEAVSDRERAAEAWNSVAEGMDGAPRFEELTPEQRETFVGYGEENWTDQDVLAELAKFQRDGLQFGKGMDARATNPYTAKELLAELRAFMRADIPGRKLLVVDGVVDLLTSSDPVARQVGAAIAVEGAYGVATDGRAFLVANRINKGTGRAKFMHEVGSHLGLEGLLPTRTYNQLTQQIINWAKADLPTTESRLARKAAERVMAAGTPAEQQRDELLAYFIEEAVQAGIDPTKALGQSAELSQWFRQLWAAMKQALQRLGFNIDRLTAQDVVNLAYGAAQLEVGGDAATSGNMKFGKSLPQGTVDKVINQLPADLRDPVRSVVSTLKAAGEKTLNMSMFTSDLLGRAVDSGIQSAAEYAKLHQQRATLATSLEREVDRIADLYDRVPAKDRGVGPASVNKFIYDTTREGNWGFKPAWRSTQNVTVDPEMKRRFDALSPESQQLVKEMFQHGDKMLALKKQTVMDSTGSEYDALIADAKQRGDVMREAELKKDKADALKKFSSLFSIQEYRPYAPLKRFGNHVVIGKSKEYMAADAAQRKKLESDPDHYHVSFTESQASADALKRQLDQQGHFAEVEARPKEVLREALYGGDATMAGLLKIKGMLADSTNRDDVAPQARAKVQQIVTELYLSALAENSSRKSEIRRKAVAGEIDMLRSFAEQGRADAQFVSSAKFSDSTMKAIGDMRREAKTGQDTATKMRLFNEVMARHMQTMEVDPTPIAQKLTRLASLWYLAFSPAYYVQNLTQPFMMSVPVMGGRFGEVRAANEMLRAYRSIAPALGSVGLTQQFDYGQLGKTIGVDEARAVNQLADEGIIDIGIDSDLGQFRIEGQGKATDMWNRVDRKVKALTQKVEATNRLSTAVAAYRLAKAQTGSHESAVRYAAQIIRDTHGDYTRFNAPRPFNTGLGKVLLQFRKFQLIQISLIAKLVKNSFIGDEQVAARKALAFTLGHTGVMAGALGLPGMAAIAWAYGMLMGDDDEPANLEYDLRKLIGDNDISNLILKGAPAAAGVDLSTKVGMATMFSLLPFTDIDLSSREGIEKVGYALMTGPFGGLGLKFADAAGNLAEGNFYRGLEGLLPSGFTNLLKAGRYATEGVTRRNGDVLMSPDEVDYLASVAQAMGFTPTEQSNRMFRQEVQVKFDEFFKDRASQVKREYAKAVKEGESTADARQAWNDLQAAREKYGYTRQPLAQLLRAGRDQSKREQGTAGGVQYNRSNRGLVEDLSEM